ncbi:hypothetical protein GGR33_001555 [Methylobacterium brachythecii]|uniref:Uncharacterized protein n=1 Tax=Methylobacterium brachythecii TaxID=1176177 RepID=A0A7W6F669_9HYPH|nr:hypothetical protein [Methylobacterium brachythecii]GLS44456.1 hypothetical protein GCM10007884_24440 [Methylobacterium brachythecii]
MSETQIRCECGAIYQRVEDEQALDEKGSFECGLCGKEIESWYTNRWPRFVLLEKPGPSPSA